MNGIDLFWKFICILVGLSVAFYVHEKTNSLYISAIASLLSIPSFYYVVRFMMCMIPTVGRVPFEKIYEKEGLVYRDDHIWVDEINGLQVFEISNGKKYVQDGNNICEVINGRIGKSILTKNGWGAWEYRKKP